MKTNLTIREILKGKTERQIEMCGEHVNAYYATPFGGELPRYQFGRVDGKVLGWFLFTVSRLYLVVECEVNEADACSQFVAYNKLFRNIANLSIELGYDIPVKILMSNAVDKEFSSSVSQKELISAASKYLPADDIIDLLGDEGLLKLYEPAGLTSKADEYLFFDFFITSRETKVIKSVFNVESAELITDGSQAGTTHPKLAKLINDKYSPIELILTSRQGILELINFERKDGHVEFSLDEDSQLDHSVLEMYFQSKSSHQKSDVSMEGGSSGEQS